MSKFLMNVLAIVGIVFPSGCLSPDTTRLPRWETGSPRAEKAGLQFFDPFPSRTAAPDTFSRPRGFIDNRTEIRRTREAEAKRRLQQQLQQQQGPTLPSQSSSLFEYSETVRE
ncbi:MAG: hypothetical protein Tsb009_18210 [Planctomycetaceae bacterium]